jgi:hypothetical protein
VRGNEEVDVEARKAAEGNSSQASELPTYLNKNPLPCSIAAARQFFRLDLQALWRVRWTASPRYTWAAAIDDSLPSKALYSLTAGFTRAQTSLITQLRTAHIPLNQHLYRIKRAPSPLCPACAGAEESIHHFLFDCRAHEHARAGLRRKLGRKSKSLRDLLGNQKAMKATLTYVAATKRLYSLFGDVTPISIPTAD